MEEYTSRELGLMMKNIDDKVTEGFLDTHTKQDLTTQTGKRARLI